MATDVTTLALAERAAGPVSVSRLQGGPESGQCLVVGVVKVAPDSFSDDGKSFHPERAIARGLELTRSGADIIEVGCAHLRRRAGARRGTSSSGAPGHLTARDEQAPVYAQ